MLTQKVAGRVYDFSHIVGRGSPSGNGFYHVRSVAIGEGDTVYVLSRGGELVPDVPWNKASRGARITKITVGTVPGDEEFVTEFGTYGDDDGKFIWPVAIALDSLENVYVTDEWLNRVSAYDRDGKFLGRWGSQGEGDGEWNRPSGIAVDREDNLFIADTLNHRVQKVTTQGKYLAHFGSLGSGDGQLNSPWGITIDEQGYVYVVDYKNNRVQKFTPEGEYVAKFGSYGAGRGQLNHPTDVAVDSGGDVYVCDWANNRVQAFGPDGKFITSFVGDAQELSKWMRQTVDANEDIRKARRRVYTMEPEWRFSLPMGVTFDPKKNRFFVADTQRYRLQIYNKLHGYLEPQFNL